MTTDMIPKKWKPGIADEPWKVLISGRDLYLIDSLLKSLCYYLTDSGSNYTLGLANIKKMSGEQIINALEDQKDVLIKTISNGLKKTF